MVRCACAGRRRHSMIAMKMDANAKITRKMLEQNKQIRGMKMFAVSYSIWQWWLLATRRTHSRTRPSAGDSCLHSLNIYCIQFVTESKLISIYSIAGCLRCVCRLCTRVRCTRASARALTLCSWTMMLLLNGYWFNVAICAEIVSFFSSNGNFRSMNLIQTMSQSRVCVAPGKRINFKN